VKLKVEGNRTKRIAQVRMMALGSLCFEKMDLEGVVLVKMSL
jgi:hypothetical protein